MGSKVQCWGPISLCLCAFLGLDLSRLQLHFPRPLARDQKKTSSGTQVHMSFRHVTIKCAAECVVLTAGRWFGKYLLLSKSCGGRHFRWLMHSLVMCAQFGYRLLFLRLSNYERQCQAFVTPRSIVNKSTRHGIDVFRGIGVFE